ncbi:hypothetical protein [Hyalangium rubrum]|uniref:Lipoprotein n=1 Tax=Hyalangium rubrum TaxID=3103134 RepID=A0ABU5H4K6_9BACT|nr:hypothetical protein [Hyalangium sp. s54d21]MDY7228037.1 hypothetical protein [Hyalangium sp. s54d21]
MRKELTAIFSIAVAALSFSQPASAGISEIARIEPGAVLAAAKDCDTHGDKNDWGSFMARECKAGGKKVTVNGWVKDHDADGQCVYVHTEFAESGSQDSDWACPKGKKIHFTLTGRGDATDVTMRKIHAQD